jgi:hypothetical protein
MCVISRSLTKTGQQQKQPRKASGRLKGRARKDARDSAKRSQGTSESSANTLPGQGTKLPTYTIAFNDFTTLAEFIAGYTQPPVKVPSNFVAAINRAISVRRAHGAHVSSLLSASGRARHQMNPHSYFIGVLERVRDVLRPQMPTELLKDH